MQNIRLLWLNKVAMSAWRETRGDRLHLEVTWGFRDRFLFYRFCNGSRTVIGNVSGIKETYNTLNSRACEQDKTLKSQKELISDLEEKCSRLNNQVSLQALWKHLNSTFGCSVINFKLEEHLPVMIPWKIFGWVIELIGSILELICSIMKLIRLTIDFLLRYWSWPVRTRSWEIFWRTRTLLSSKYPVGHD